MIKRTLQEIANFFDMALAMDEDGSWYLYTAKPILMGDHWNENGNIFCGLTRELIDHSGNWRNSLTLPESWTKEPPFKEGEVVINIELGFPSVWRKEYDLNVDEYRRPTEAEWKVLRGEE